jgi:hypothetical protein
MERENSFWNKISEPPEEKQPKQENIDKGDGAPENMEVDEKSVENRPEVPGVIEGEVKENKEGLRIISTEFSDLRIPEDKFKDLFGDIKEGEKIKLTPLSPEDLSRLVINELLNPDTNEDEGEENN